MPNVGEFSTLNTLRGWLPMKRRINLTFDEIYKEGHLPNNIEWKPMKDFEDKFMVSNYGHVKRLYRVIRDSLGRKHTYEEKIFYPKMIKNKKFKEDCYTRVSFGKYRDTAHRIVAKTFLENPNNYPEVNHIDGNKKFLSYAGTEKNNYKDGNLEWCSRKQNMIHASKTGLLNTTSEKRKEAVRKNQKISVERNKKKVTMFNMEMEYLAEFESVKIAGHLMDIPKENISRACINEAYSAGGFKWRYR